MNDGELPKDVISDAKRVEIVWQLCCAVINMHDYGIYHRDLKPANIMLGAGLNALLGDFGGTKDQESVIQGGN